MPSAPRTTRPPKDPLHSDVLCGVIQTAAFLGGLLGEVTDYEPHREPGASPPRRSPDRYCRFYSPQVDITAAMQWDHRGKVSLRVHWGADSSDPSNGPHSQHAANVMYSIVGYCAENDIVCARK